jgi:hypothetical protein
MRVKTDLRTLACLLVTLALTCGASAPALGASSSNAIINDCQATGRLTHSYTLSELQTALKSMPAYVKQYSNCSDVITQGIITVKHHKQTGPTDGGGGSFLPTPVIIILVVLILAAVTFGAIAIRQRRGGSPAAPPDAPPADGPPPGTGPPA